MKVERFYFFDLDGTLADTDADIRGAWRTVLDDMGLECPDFEEKFVAGPPIDVMLKTLFPTQYTDAMADEVRRRFGHVYDNCGFHHTPEYPGVMDAVRAIKRRGDRVFIVTNKRILGAKALAAKYGWMEVFEGLYTGDMLVEGIGNREQGIGKRMLKTELLAYVMKELGAEKEQCVMIGDTISDFEAATKNGVKSVGVTWGYGGKGIGNREQGIGNRGKVVGRDGDVGRGVGGDLVYADIVVTKPEELLAVSC